MEFLSYLRLLATGALIAFYSYDGSENYLHTVMITLIVHFLLYLWKGEYKYPVL